MKLIHYDVWRTNIFFNDLVFFSWTGPRVLAGPGSSAFKHSPLRHSLNALFLLTFVFLIYSLRPSLTPWLIPSLYNNWPGSTGQITESFNHKDSRAHSQYAYLNTNIARCEMLGVTNVAAWILQYMVRYLVMSSSTDKKWRGPPKRNSWMYNFVEVSGHNLESSQTWGFCMDFLNHRVGGMVFYQVFLRSPLQYKAETVRGYVSLKK
jgi:hypothetical protein